MPAPFPGWLAGFPPPESRPLVPPKAIVQVETNDFQKGQTEWYAKAKAKWDREDVPPATPLCHSTAFAGPGPALAPSASHNARMVVPAPAEHTPMPHPRSLECKGTTEKSARSRAQIAHTSHSPRQDAFLRQRPADPEDVAINCQAYSLVPEATAHLTGPSPDTC